MKKQTWMKIITVIEIVIAFTVVLLDLFIPTLIVLGMILISLWIRREKITTLGFKKPESWFGLIIISFASVIFLQLFDIGVSMPVLNRLTGTRIDYSGFSALQGNLQQLIMFLLLGWTLAALGEEIIYRGYFQKLLFELFGSEVSGVWITIGISSIIFGLAHLEQGIIGVVVTTFDAVIFSLLRRKFNDNLWAAILAHGFYNTIGMVVFYFTGPIYGLW